MSSPFLGEVRIVGFNFPMRGWALCNGQTLSIAQNTALFSILGTTYGGNGVSTFQLPNFQGLFPLGQGNGPGLPPAVLGEIQGSPTVTVLTSNLPSHNHTLQAAAGPPTTTAPTGAALATLPRSAPPIYAAGPPNASLSPPAISTTGGGQPFPNLQPYLVVTFVIALTGIFPSRN